MTRKYSEAVQESVEKAMHKMKQGQLKSGGSRKTLKSKKRQLQLDFLKLEKREPGSTKERIAPSFFYR